MDMSDMDMSTENAEQTVQRGTGENIRGHSSAAPQCLHSLCSQASAYASRFSGDRSQARPLGAALHRSAEPPRF